jgi:hypothetical protein
MIVNPASTFNSFFSSPPINEQVLCTSENDFVDHPSVVTITNQPLELLNFSFEPVSLEYVAKLLLDLDEKKSCGPDGFTPKILKLSAPAIAISLTKLFNYCITTSTWPEDWKLSNVSPVHKKDDVTDKRNYRPISVLSAIAKVFEKIKYEQLYTKFSTIFSSNMSGFLRGHSCCSALVKLTDDWRVSLDNKKEVGVIVI